MRLLITGDRNWTDEFAIAQTLNFEFSNITAIIEGQARGADRLAGRYADRYKHIEHLKFPADWDKYLKAAGPIRNQQMLEEGMPDQVVAFHDNLPESKGTHDMIKRSIKAGLPVWHYSHQEGLHPYEGTSCRERREAEPIHEG